VTARSEQIRNVLIRLRAVRRSRRSRHSRYRPVGCATRRRCKGWQASTGRSRVSHLLSQVNRQSRWESSRWNGDALIWRSCKTFHPRGMAEQYGMV
jgi:hypothetical protein